MRVRLPPLQLMQTIPKHYLDKFTDRGEAERSKDWHELTHEFACSIIEYGGEFYVVWAD